MPKCELATDGILMFWCPGCNEHHGIPVDGSRGWQWNESFEMPTITPSILVRQTLYGPDKLTFSNYKGEHPPSESAQGVCHSFVTDGSIQYLDDCTHKLSGKTVKLPEIS